MIIDTGSPERPFAANWGRIDKCEVLMTSILDGLPPSPALEAISAATVSAIIGELHDSKMLETVRGTFCAYWPLIHNLAWASPAGFDEIVMAYAELTTVLPEGRSEVIARRKASAPTR